MRLFPIIALVLFAAAAQPARAQGRPVELREALVSLTRVLGESHALRQACEGAGDQYWRSRMTRLIETERPDPELERQLKDSFNAGFAESRRLHRSCDEGARRAQGLTAARGRELSNELSHAQYRMSVVPPPVEGEGADATAETAPR